MQKTLHKEELNISELVNTVVGKMQNLATLKNINLTFTQNLDTKILGNKMELERVLYNIINNAITHTKVGQITLTEKLGNNKYVLEIVDTGTGIPKEILTKIFDPFFRGETSRTTSGAGLGLTLVKKIVENHNGKIKIESEISRGTKVIITLPLHRDFI
jgi:signal transduction histidine kinase